MKNLIRSCTLIALSGALAAPAHAALTAATLDCNNINAVSAMSALDCSGAWSGNDVNQKTDVLAQLATDFGGIGLWSYAGTTNAGETSGPFASVPSATSGYLGFDSPETGVFAVALKGGNAFSLYLFDGGDNGLSGIDFVTFGTAFNSNERPQALSHASLYRFQGATPPVPEPETYAMLLVGLGLVGFAASRRRMR